MAPAPLNHEPVMPTNTDIKIESAPTIITAIPPSKQTIAQDWIRANNPAVGEKTVDYYARYCAATRDPVANIQFGPIAKQVLNRKPVQQRADGTRKW
jgi:hypothetical protein